MGKRKPLRVPWHIAMDLAERSELSETEAQDIMAATFAAAGNRLYDRKLLATRAAYQLGLERGRKLTADGRGSTQMEKTG